MADFLQHIQLDERRFDSVVTECEYLFHFIGVQKVFVQLDLHIVHSEPDAPVVFGRQSLPEDALFRSPQQIGHVNGAQ